MSSVRQLLFDLVAVRSDTGTAMEKAMGEKIFAIVSESPYFKEHPALCGMDAEGDIFGRPVVWALRKGRSDRTIILSGHYDAVEIDSYGKLKPWALDPPALRKKLEETELHDPRLIADLKDENWFFGRGIADMKAGVAINLHTLFTNADEDVNILFTAVQDEENMSAGTLHSIHLYNALKKKFGLDYKLMIIAEPQFRNPDMGGPLYAYSGGCGKILPVIVAKGVIAHCATVMEGLNAAYLMSEIVRGIELNTDLSTSDRGESTQPPTVQFLRDLKTAYDVSIPEYATALVNLLFFDGRRAPGLLRKIKEICAAAFAAAIEKYNAAYAFGVKNGGLDPRGKKNFKPVVYEVGELEKLLTERGVDFAALSNGIRDELRPRIASGEITLQNASVEYVRGLLDAALLDYPAVVVGIAPPYYPSVSNVYLDADIAPYLDAAARTAKEEFGTNFENPAYLTVMGDISYMTCVDPAAERKILNNLALPKSLYDIPFEEIAQCNVPTIYMGPGARDVHHWAERVYMPDVEKLLPRVLEKLIAAI